MKPILKPKSRLSGVQRIVYIIIGFVMLCSLLVYGINWENPFDITFMGISTDSWINAGFVVIIGLIGASLLKSGLLGESRLD